MSISRVSTYQMNKSFASQINSTQSKFNKLAQQISSGKRVTSMTDDIVSAKSILKANKELENIGLYQSNLKQADNELSQTDSTLKSINDQLQKAYDVAMSVSNGTMGTEQLAAYQEELDAIIDNVTRLANTKYGDQYLFAGTATTTQPYSMVSTDDATVANAGLVYAGNNGARYAIVDEGKTQQINFTGSELFGGASFTTDQTTGQITMDDANSSGVFGALYSLKAAIQDGDNIDTDKLKESMGNIKTGMENVTAIQTKVGAMGSEMDDMLATYDTDVLNVKELRSNLEDTDLPSAISDWYSVYQSLQASYSMMSQVANVSLLNYI